jgi:hypothetical protein|tara:strand:+ start:820 stop:1182 length:363 start_codon:yes stop_codon:yes gene_type:complete
MVSSNIDALTFDRQQINQTLDKRSKEFTDAYDVLVELEDDVKLHYAKLFISFKEDVVKRSAEEIKHLITTDDMMRELVAELNQAKKTHMKAKTEWDKLKTKIMLLQSELKQNLEFNSMGQ